jgi:hypothetical protein
MSDRSDQRGPWLLALGALAIGIMALAVEGCRLIRERSRPDDATDR